MRTAVSTWSKASIRRVGGLGVLAAALLPEAAALVQEPLRLQRLARPVSAAPVALRRRHEPLASLRGGEQLDAALGETAHMKSAEDVIKMAAVDPAVGLSDDEVLARREQYGLNQLPTKERVPLWKRFFAQFDDKMVLARRARNWPVTRLPRA